MREVIQEQNRPSRVSRDGNRDELRLRIGKDWGLDFKRKKLNQGKGAGVKREYGKGNW